MDTAQEIRSMGADIMSGYAAEERERKRRQAIFRKRDSYYYTTISQAQAELERYYSYSDEEKEILDPAVSHLHEVIATPRPEVFEAMIGNIKNAHDIFDIVNRKHTGHFDYWYWHTQHELAVLRDKAYRRHGLDNPYQTERPERNESTRGFTWGT